MGLDAPFIKIITKIDEASYESVRKKINNIFKSANSRQIKIKFKLDTKELNEITKKVSSQKDKEVKITTTADTKAVTEVENKIKGVENEADKASNKTVRVKSDNSALEKTQSLLAKFGDVARMQALTGVFRLLTSSVHLAGEAIYNLDKAQTEYNKVTELTNKQMKSQIDDLQSMGREVGRTTSEMIEGTTGWKKAGFSDTDAAKLSKITALYQNTADEILSTSQATDILTSIIKAYNISADDAIQVTDKINNVSAKFAVNSGDLGNGLKVSSASMSTFGNSIDQTMGMLTAGTTIFQHQSSRVARGLNTVAINITKNKDALSKYGINVEDANGHLKSTYDVLNELKPKWDAMTDAEKTSLGQTLAGKNQYAILTAVLSKWKEAQDAVVASQNSAGTTMQQNARYMESLQAKIQNLKAAFEQLVTSNGGLGSMAKLFLDLSTGALHLISNLGGLPPILMGIASALTIIKSEQIATHITKVVDSLKNGVTAVKNFGVSLKNIIQSIHGLNDIKSVGVQLADNFRSNSTLIKNQAEASLQAKNALKGLSDAEKEVAIQQEATNIAMGNAVTAIGGVMAVVAIAMSVWQAYSRARDEQARKEEEAFNDSLTQMDKLQDAQKVIKDETSSRQDLIQAINNTDLANKNELQSLSDTTEMRKKAIKEIEKQQKAEYELNKAKIHEKLNPKSAGFSGFSFFGETRNQLIRRQYDVNADTKTEKDIQKYSKEFLHGKQDITSQQKYLAHLIKDYNKLSKAVGENTQAGKQYQGISKDLSNIYNKNDKAIKEAIKSGDKYGKFLDKNDKKQLKSLRDAQKDSQAILSGENKKVQAHKKSTKELSAEQARQKQLAKDSKSSLDDLTKRYSKMYNVSKASLSKNMANIKAIADKYGLTISEAMDMLGYSSEKASEKVADAYDNFQKLEQSFQSSVQSIGNLASGYNSLTTACEEYNQQGYLNLDTLQNLLSQSPEFLACLDFEGDKLTINEEKYRQVAESQINAAEAKAYLEAQAILTGKAIDEESQSANNSVSAHESAKSGMQVAESEMQNLINIVNQGTQAWNEYAKAASQGAVSNGVSKDQADKALDTLHTRLTMLESAKKNLGNITQHMKSNTRATRSNTGAVGGNNRARKNGGGATKGHTGATKKNTDAVKKNTDALKKRQKVLQDEVQKYETVIDYIKKKVSDYIDEIEKAKDKEIDAIDKEIDEISKLADERDDYYQKQIDNINDLASKEEDYYNKKIEQIQAVNDEIEDNIQLQQLLDNLEKAKKTKVKVYHEGQGFIYDIDQNAVNEAQKELDDYKRQKQVDAEIKALENERDTKKAIYDQQIKDLETRQKKEKESFDLQTKQLEQHKKDVEKHYDDIIKYWQDWNDQFQKQVDAYKDHQNALLAEQLTGINFENNNWTTRLNNLGNFVNNYRAKCAELEEVTRRLNQATAEYEAAQARASQASGYSPSGGGGGGGRSSGGGGGGRSASSSVMSNVSNTVVNAAVSAVSSMFGASPIGKVYTWHGGTPYQRKENGKWKNYSTADGNHGFKVTSQDSTYLYGTSHRGNYIRVKKSLVFPTNRKNAYASGVSSIGEDEIAFVGDSADTNELVIGSKLNGTPLSMKKGTGVVNAKSTNTLAGLLNQLSTNPTQTTNTVNNNHGGNQTFVVENVNINGSQIKDAQTFANALLNIRGEAMQRAYKK